MTEVTPTDVYVAGKTPGDLRGVLFAAGLKEIEGGRLRGVRGEDAGERLREEMSHGQ